MHAISNVTVTGYDINVLVSACVSNLVSNYVSDYVSELIYICLVIVIGVKNFDFNFSRDPRQGQQTPMARHRHRRRSGITYDVITVERLLLFLIMVVTASTSSQLQLGKLLRLSDRLNKRLIHMDV